MIEPSTVSADLDGGMVIIGQAQEQYYGLNEVGARIWQLIQMGLSLGEIQERLMAEYDTPAEVLWQDILRLADDLVREGLVIVQES